MLIDKPYYDYDYEYVEPKKERRVMSEEERRNALMNNFGFKMKLRGGEKNPESDLERAEALQREAMAALAAERAQGA